MVSSPASVGDRRRRPRSFSSRPIWPRDGKVIATQEPLLLTNLKTVLWKGVKAAVVPGVLAGLWTGYFAGVLAGLVSAARATVGYVAISWLWPVLRSMLLSMLLSALRAMPPMLVWPVLPAKKPRSTSTSTSKRSRRQPATETFVVDLAGAAGRGRPRCVLDEPGGVDSQRIVPTLGTGDLNNFPIAGRYQCQRRKWK